MFFFIGVIHIASQLLLNEILLSSHQQFCYYDFLCLTYTYSYQYLFLKQASKIHRNDAVIKEEESVEVVETMIENKKTK